MAFQVCGLHPAQRTAIVPIRMPHTILACSEETQRNHDIA